MAFLVERVRSLEESLAREVKENLVLQDRVQLLEKALARVAQRVPANKGGTGDDVGANAETDPVPHSG